MTALPDSIIQNGLFCCWKYEERNGQKTKVPYQPETGRGAKSNDPSSFVLYKTAVQASGYDGIGIGIFNGICAIDLDNCVSDSGYYTQTAAEIVALMHSYTEYSPSGNGLHILFSAKGFQYDTKRFYIMNHQAGIEVYVAGATNKYVTVTGNRCEDYEYGDRTQELQVLLDKFMRRPEIGAENAINAKNSDLSMEQLLQLAKSSKNGTAFTALWNGSLEGYSSPSEADLALCSHLAFWTGRDAAKMDTMFRQSGLMRDKWDRQQSGTTYGAITIQKAIEHCREIYTPKAEPSPVFQPIVPLTPQWSDLPAFPVDALPDVIRNYVSAVAEHSQTAPDMAAVISLGVLATCLQGKYKIEGTPGYCEPLSLYTVVIAAPGERKSSVMRDMTTFLYEYEQEYNKAHSMEIRENHVPVVEKQILWSKRCKDKSLVGTIKETIMQVSSSKKWLSKPALDEQGVPILQKNGKPVLRKSYSVLQDDFFQAMRNAGYTDVERGERGSSEEHLTVTQFKVEREQERLEQLTAQTQQKEQQAASLEKKIEKIQKQQIAVQKVEQIEPHAVPFSSKVMLDRSEYENLAAAAKKFYVQERKESKLQKALDTALKMVSELKAKVATLTAELAEYKSVRGQLNTAGLEQQNELLMNKLHRYETVIERNGLWNLFRPSRKPDHKRQEERR